MTEALIGLRNVLLIIECYVHFRLGFALVLQWFWWDLLCMQCIDWVHFMKLTVSLLRVVSPQYITACGIFMVPCYNKVWCAYTFIYASNLGLCIRSTHAWEREVPMSVPQPVCEKLGKDFRSLMNDWSLIYTGTLVNKTWMSLNVQCLRALVNSQFKALQYCSSTQFYEKSHWYLL